jgi:hypothetical protein
MALFSVAVLMATDAGRDSENGTGAMWVAPELVVSSPLVQTCGQPAGQRSELVFETLEPDDIDTELPRLMAMAAREVVDFEWHSATGELSFSTTAPSAVFSDLEFPTSRASAHQGPSCGSR